MLNAMPFEGGLIGPGSVHTQTAVPPLQAAATTVLGSVQFLTDFQSEVSWGYAPLVTCTLHNCSDWPCREGSC